jgi:hypothetical protein
MRRQVGQLAKVDTDGVTKQLNVSDSVHRKSCHVLLKNSPSNNILAWIYCETVKLIRLVEKSRSGFKDIVVATV